ncbi:MAG: ECF transporter S component [Ruminococcus sp.]|nr:ECF transporter S component [Ruminococcus sp.]
MKTKFNTRSMVLLGLLMAIVLLFSLTPIGTIPIGPLSITLNIIPIAIAGIALGPVGGLIVGTFFGIFSFLQCYGIGPLSSMGAILVDINPVLAFIQRVLPRALDGLLVGLIYKGMTKLRAKRAYYAVAGLVTSLFGVALFLSIMQFAFSHSVVGDDGTKTWVRDKVMDDLMSSGGLIWYICITVALLLFCIGYLLVSGHKLTRMQVSSAVTGFCAALLNTIFFMSALVILFGNTDYVKNLIDSKGNGNVLLFIVVLVGINALFEMVVSTVVTTAVGSALHKAKLVEGPEEEVDVKAAEKAVKKAEKELSEAKKAEKASAKAGKAAEKAADKAEELAEEAAEEITNTEK